MTWLYLLAILLSILLFYRLTHFKVIKNKFWVYLCILVVGTVCTFYGYKTILIYNLITIIILNIIHRKNNNFTLITGVLIFIFSDDLIIEFFRGILLDIIGNFSVSKDIVERVNLICFFFFFIATYLIGIYVGKFVIKKLIGKNFRIFFWILLYLYLVALIIAIVYAETRNVPPATIFFISFLTIQFIFSIGLYYLMVKNQKVLLKKSQQDKLIKEQKQLQDYAEYLERSEDELRAFRHDYRNMFNSLKISAQEGDTKELIQKLDEYTKTNLNAKAFEKYRDVNHIKVKSLKSIIIAKFTEMYGSDIPYNFECRDNITKIPNNINELDLVRIIGISCNNAIEVNHY